MGHDTPEWRFPLIFGIQCNHQNGPCRRRKVDTAETTVDGTITAALSVVPDGHDGAAVPFGETGQRGEQRPRFVRSVHVHASAKERTVVAQSGRRAFALSLLPVRRALKPGDRRNLPFEPP